MEVISETKSILNPLDRAAEILFGLIMALTFTCSIGIATKGNTQIRELLIGAIGCNMAWGLVDATMYLTGVLARRNRNKLMFDSIQNPLQIQEARRHISDALPPVLASALGTEELDQIRNQLIKVPNGTPKVTLTFNDLKKAFALFFLIFMSTFPVVLPFVFMPDPKDALRLSNLVAIVMMFLCGWSVAKYVGFNKWLMSIAMVSIGILLVCVTIALGG
jgi:VIT1/CCC1 family predicted Fe2+/Mn2+ transporter